ncbi:MAG TPA: 2-polyprenyl-3-methyl-6-methoxy-1,4-benzoquinone monooxygenase [Cellvibrionaceae bacterium]
MNLRDQLIGQFDSALRSLTRGTQPQLRASPADKLPETELTAEQQRHAAGLMRVNHSGEVCAQGLYQGQALTARLVDTRHAMQTAAQEEIDHLAWCEERLTELKTHPSLLNPVWYGLSFGLGAAAGLVGDKVSLGFVAATEESVCKHLETHLVSLPQSDEKSRAIVDQMLVDERHHEQGALQAGGINLPLPVKALMRLTAKVMTHTSYRI